VEDLLPRWVRGFSLPLPRFKIPHVIDTVTEPLSISGPSLLVGWLFIAHLVAQGVFVGGGGCPTLALPLATQERLTRQCALE
jgi:hypothetical protein